MGSGAVSPRRSTVAVALGCIAVSLALVAAYAPGRVVSPARAASASTSSIAVVGLGDSVTAGSNCDCRDFVYLYADIARARTGRSIVVHNLGQGGLTAVELLQQLRTDAEVQRRVSRARVVLVTIGANDQYPSLRQWQRAGCDRSCWGPRVDRLQSGIAAIVSRVQALRGGQRTLVMVTNYWNVFEDGDVAVTDYGSAFLSWSERLTRVANTRICAGALAAGARCTDLYTPFKDADGGSDPTGLLADDGDHPNAAGHRVIAGALARTGLPWRG